MANKYYGNQLNGIDNGGNDLSGKFIPPPENNFFGTYSEDQEYLRDSGAENGLTGHSYSALGAGQTFNRSKQMKSDTGDSSVTIDGGEGGEKITLSHATGATVMIDADGSIFIIPKGRKGVGIGSPSGPLALSGQRLVLTSDGGIEMNTNEFRLKTKGDFSIIAGGTLNIKAGNFHQHVSGNYQNYVAGDNVDVSGGIKREVVGGEKRSQVSGFYKVDVGDSYTLRAEAKSSFNFQDDVYFVSNKNIETNAGENITSVSQKETKIQSTEDMNLNSNTNLTATSKENMNVYADGNTKITSKGQMSVFTDSSMEMTASDSFTIESDGSITLNSAETMTIYGDGGSVFSSGGRTELTASGRLQLNYAETRSPTAPGSVGSDVTNVGSPNTQNAENAANVNEIKSASDVELLASSEIQDKLSTFNKYPLVSDNYIFGSSGATRVADEYVRAVEQV